MIRERFAARQDDPNVPALQGLSISVYVSALGKWRQTWGLITTAATWISSADLFGGEMALSMERTLNGKTNTYCMVFYNITEGSLDWDSGSVPRTAANPGSCSGASITSAKRHSPSQNELRSGAGMSARQYRRAIPPQLKIEKACVANLLFFNVFLLAFLGIPILLLTIPGARKVYEELATNPWWEMAPGQRSLLYPATHLFPRLDKRAHNSAGISYRKNFIGPLGRDIIVAELPDMVSNSRHPQLAAWDRMVRHNPPPEVSPRLTRLPVLGVAKSLVAPPHPACYALFGPKRRAIMPMRAR